MKLCVLGMGYIGLPTAVMFANHGLQVHGVDVDDHVVASLSKNELHIEEPGLNEMLNKVVNEGNFTVSTEVEPADVYLIAVPTPVTENNKANLNFVQNATEMITPYVIEGNLVVLESTVPPNTVENVMVPVLKQTGLSIGEEIFISHSPERVIPGKLFEELIYNDRIVGGINEESSKRTKNLYQTFVKGNIYLTDSTTAEMVKLLENTYRDVNIAFANEVARIAEDLDFNAWEAIKLANYHPRVNIHAPGPGVGGHCIAVDPYFIIEQSPDRSKLISLARNINSFTPTDIADSIEKQVEDIQDPTITIMGLSYKGNIDDIRESPSLDILNELLKKGFNVNSYDPYVKAEVYGKKASIESATQNTDLVVFLTDHHVFREILPYNLTLKHKRVFDTKDIIDKEKWIASGFSYNSIGMKIGRNSEVNCQ